MWNIYTKHGVLIEQGISATFEWEALNSAADAHGFISFAEAETALPDIWSEAYGEILM